MPLHELLCSEQSLAGLAGYQNRYFFVLSNTRCGHGVPHHGSGRVPTEISVTIVTVPFYCYQNKQECKTASLAGTLQQPASPGSLRTRPVEAAFLLARDGTSQGAPSLALSSWLAFEDEDEDAAEK